MRLKTTLILAVLVGLAFLAARYLGGDEPVTEPSRSPLVDSEVMAHLDEIELHLFSKEKLRIRRDEFGNFIMVYGRLPAENKHWHLQDRIDPVQVQALLGAIEVSWREPLEGEFGDDDALRYNLVNPVYGLTVRSSKGTVQIDFGASDPARAGMILARERGSKFVFRTSRQVPNLLDLNLQDFRDRELLSLDVRSIDELGVAIDDEKEGFRQISIVREGARRWRFQYPRQVKADANKVLAYIQRARAVRADRYTMPLLDVPEMQERTGLPDRPHLTITLSSGGVTEVLTLGNELTVGEIAGCLPSRDPLRCFIVTTEDVDRLLEISFDDLRARSVFPPIESTMVGVRSSELDGRIRWNAEREGKNPRGSWKLKSPIESDVHTGSGIRSWDQLVADLSRLQVDEFLDPSTSFRPKMVLEIEWFEQPLVRTRRLEIQPDPESGSALIRTDDRGEEVLRVDGQVAAIAGLNPELYQSRILLEYSENALSDVSAWWFQAGEKEISLERVNVAGRQEIRAIQDPERELTRVTGGANGLFGAEALDLVPAGEVLNSGLEDPTFVFKMTWKDTEYTLTVGNRSDLGDWYYCTFTPRFEPGLVLSIPKVRLSEFLAILR